MEVDGSSIMSLPDLSVLKWDASWPGFRFREAWFGSDAGVSSFSSGPYLISFLFLSISSPDSAALSFQEE